MAPPPLHTLAGTCLRWACSCFSCEPRRCRRPLSLPSRQRSHAPPSGRWRPPLSASHALPHRVQAVGAVPVWRDSPHQRAGEGNGRALLKLGRVHIVLDRWRMRAGVPVGAVRPAPIPVLHVRPLRGGEAGEHAVHAICSPRNAHSPARCRAMVSWGVCELHRLCLELDGTTSPPPAYPSHPSVCPLPRCS